MIHKTAKGREIDMTEITKQHENMKAVGNVPMNAKGDRLDKEGNVIKTVQAKETPAPQPVSRAATPKKKRGPKVTRKLVVDGSVLKIEITTDGELVVYNVMVDNDDHPYIEMSTSKRGSIVAKMAKKRKNGEFYFEFENADGSMDIVELPPDNVGKLIHTSRTEEFGKLDVSS